MPNYGQRQVQRARFAIETTFGTDLTTDVATNFFDVRHEPLVLSRDTMMAADTTVVQRNYQRNNYVRGPDHGGMALSAFWLGLDGQSSLATPATKTSQSKMLEALLGGYHHAAGSNVDSGPTTTGATVSTGEGVNFVIGGMAAVVVAGVPYPVTISDVSGDVIAWWPALPNAPSVGAAIYNGQTNYLTDTPVKWIQALYEDAKDRGNIWLGVGGQGDFSLDITRGQLAKWASTIRFAKWLHDDEITTPQGGSAIALATHYGLPAYANEGGFHFNETGTTVRQLVRMQSLTLNFGVEWFEVGHHSGTEGLSQWERNTRPEITAELMLLAPGSYEAFHDFWSSETDVGFTYWLGTTAGEIRAISAPTCHIMKAPEAVEVYGMEGIKLSLLLKENDRVTSQATEAARSPFRVSSM
jgi:hypothetical protein